MYWWDCLAVESPPWVGIWQESSTRIIDYAPDSNDQPILVIPSLVNRAYILDLMTDQSFLDYLKGKGLHPFLLDWDSPTAAEERFTLNDYYQRAERGMDTIYAHKKMPLHVLGYCMGGAFALAAGLKKTDKVKSISLFATPWDFHHSTQQQNYYAQNIPPLLKFLKNFHQEHLVPVDILQALFSSIDPLSIHEKFCKFAELDSNSDQAIRFVALEDWLNDGIPLAYNVALECFEDWYLANKLQKGIWRMGHLLMDPTAIKIPNIHVIAEDDRIVPPESSRALAHQMPHAKIISEKIGHIGIMASKKAQELVWDPWAQMLKAIS